MIDTRLSPEGEGGLPAGGDAPGRGPELVEPAVRLAEVEVCLQDLLDEGIEAGVSK